MKLMMNNAPREATVCKVALAAALVAMLLFAACSNPAGSREGKYAAVDDFDLSGLSITAPAQGVAVSSLPAISGDQYTGAGEWVKESGAAYVGATFDGGTVYKAKYVLHTKGDFTFTGITGPFTFGGLTVEIAANTGSTLTILIIFPATTGTASDPDSDGSGSGGDGSTTEGSLINAINLAPNIATPVLGGTPTTAFSEERYEASAILWTPSVGSVFAASTSYQAEVTLIAKGTYTFKNPIAITHGSASAAPITVSYTNSTAIKVTLKFPPTGSTSATSFNLGPYNYPKVGSTPTELGLAGVDASSPEYTVAKSLSLTSGGDAVTSIESDKTFYLTLTLTAKPGFNFNGVTASSISATFKNFTDVPKAFTRTNFSNDGSVIKVTLSHAEFVSEKKVTDLEKLISGGIYVFAGYPFGGFTQNTWFDNNDSNPQYRRKQQISPNDNPIKANTQYSFIVDYEAKPGWTFSGVTAANIKGTYYDHDGSEKPLTASVNSNNGTTMNITYSAPGSKSENSASAGIDLSTVWPPKPTKDQTFYGYYTTNSSSDHGNYNTYFSPGVSLKVWYVADSVSGPWTTEVSPNSGQKFVSNKYYKINVGIAGRYHFYTLYDTTFGFTHSNAASITNVTGSSGPKDHQGQYLYIIDIIFKID
ncbi:hypothetical protein [Leadbettera azotonutricia]|uniref:hypothetical protein n=1 Tax=Leadbettera azotonutricia TaxID=150829 RepID=UPI00031915B9|nr:hypothetical protein [Leadbettera azotonutricia]